MRHLLLVALLWPLAPAAQEALTPAAAEHLRQQATALTAQGDSTGATAALDEALAGGLTSPDALLDLGRLHIARGDAGPAVLTLERASRLDPLSPPLASARREAYALAGQIAPRVPRPLVASRATVARLGAGALVALSLVLYLGTVVLGFLWRRTRDRRHGWAALGLAPLALIALVASALALWDAGRPLGVVQADVPVLVRPTPEAATAAALREGDVVTVGDTSGLWRRVDLGEVEGWVPARAVERL